MKQGINYIMKVECQDINVNDVTAADFIAKQGNKMITWKYPSDNCIKVDSHTFGLVWTVENTFEFVASEKIGLDAKIYLHGSNYSVEVLPTSFEMTATLFKR